MVGAAHRAAPTIYRIGAPPGTHTHNRKRTDMTIEDVPAVLDQTAGKWTTYDTIMIIGCIIVLAIAVGIIWTSTRNSETRRPRRSSVIIAAILAATALSAGALQIVNAQHRAETIEAEQAEAVTLVEEHIERSLQEDYDVKAVTLSTPLTPDTARALVAETTGVGLPADGITVNVTLEDGTTSELTALPIEPGSPRHGFMLIDDADNPIGITPIDTGDDSQQ